MNFYDKKKPAEILIRISIRSTDKFEEDPKFYPSV